MHTSDTNHIGCQQQEEASASRSCPDAILSVQRTVMALPDLDVGQSVGKREALEIENGYGLEHDES